jgi:hypothetical protein
LSLFLEVISTLLLIYNSMDVKGGKSIFRVTAPLVTSCRVHVSAMSSAFYADMLGASGELLRQSKVATV